MARPSLLYKQNTVDDRDGDQEVQVRSPELPQGTCGLGVDMCRDEDFKTLGREWHGRAVRES